jgi:hypothetical protein
VSKTAKTVLATVFLVGTVGAIAAWAAYRYGHADGILFVLDGGS